jgi:CubicO group peptidase (beta-lactamase class C family)
MLHDLVRDTSPGGGAGGPRRPADLTGRRSRHVRACLLVSFAVVTAVAAATAACGGAETPASAGIRAEVQALVSGPIPGALLYVRQGDRSYTVAVGYADKARKVPMRAGDTYAIGSTTKTFTAVLIMRLVAQGKLGLDAPISRYLPDLLPDGNRITVRELLSHTSGLYDYEDSPGMLPDVRFTSSTPVTVPVAPQLICDGFSSGWRPASPGSEGLAVAAAGAGRRDLLAVSLT